MSLLVCSAQATNEGSSSQLTIQTSLKAMERVFLRSERAHSTSMASIMSSMSSTRAWNILEKGNLTTPALIEMQSQSHGKQSHLRKAAPPGYAAVEGARTMLNDMIYESMSKYDLEITKCTAYYAEQCAAMQACRGQISSSNYMAAKSRLKIVHAQSTLNQMQGDIAVKKQELKNHKAKCDEERKNLHKHLQIVQGDITVLTEILKMTDCKTFVQTELALLHCEDPCSKKHFITFNHDGLKQKVSKLQSSLSKGLMQDTFKDLYETREPGRFANLLETDARQMPFVNKTDFNNPPVPRTSVPRNPCTDPNAGAPSDEQQNKGKGKCSLSNSTNCPKLRERFLLLQAGIQDEQENLVEEIKGTQESCDAVAATLDTEIQNDVDRGKEAETDLADAMTMEATSGEAARQTARKNDGLDLDLKKQMKICSNNYINFESEICALKKIRGELYKKLKGGHPAFFQDCKVSDWNKEECNKKCGGGEEKLTRNVLNQPNKGAKCLPLTALKKCHLEPCPVDCKLAPWDGWSKCSAQCGGGVQERLRDVTVAMKHGGDECGATSETRACNGEACEKDCSLGDWTAWRQCSKDCDGGTQKRYKFVAEQAKGDGKCPGRWSKNRLEYKPCNMNRCVLASGAQTLTCKQELDVVLLLDGSGSLTQAGWDAEMKAAKMFVGAFAGSGTQSDVAVVLYSGPSTWSGVHQCFGSKQRSQQEALCKIKSVTHFTSDMAAVQAQIGKLTWPQGSTLTSLALMHAREELRLGRKNAKSIVVVFTDGKPLSLKATGLASKEVRKAARLVWVPITPFAPLANIKSWATRRWQENVVPVQTFDDLETNVPINQIIANICPKTN